MIYIGADHRGFELKEMLKEWLMARGYEVEDVGGFVNDPEDDYIDSAFKVAEMVAGGAQDKGILLCGSGHGADIVANKFREIRAILGFNRNVVRQGREDEDANVLVLPANWTNEDQAREWVEIFLETPASDIPRHKRRRQRLATIRTI